MRKQTESTSDKDLSESRTMDVCDAEDDPAYGISSLAVDTGIEDLAIEHDHYLYGTPKQNPRLRSPLQREDKEQE
ncbi:MAG: Uncharacterized protein XE11_2101 [Methanomicrobiales archaeon 53_19]|uniref:hypothetical protein n=1 Tax=Methanocalculus sp. TaxID=2004547 RepID=UPI00074A0B4E|nr:hypothetical protein [Methanocalculus sp.]KUK68828.1 MAG: Uncharacterized protein XD88_1739 [Methanocalculus sp. 52_23]KUL01508.1 MAG: Uncharacterized protein XE11_2101 [Methanomicrobiales archaeon 53_19]HIJ06506.1 hypothetical protein [Methanocalculus sp.]